MYFEKVEGNSLNSDNAMQNLGLAGEYAFQGIKHSLLLRIVHTLLYFFVILGYDRTKKFELVCAWLEQRLIEWDCRCINSFGLIYVG